MIGTNGIPNGKSDSKSLQQQPPSTTMVTAAAHDINQQDDAKKDKGKAPIGGSKPPTSKGVTKKDKSIAEETHENALLLANNANKNFDFTLNKA